MSSNIFKGSFIQFTSENTRVIDSQALFAKRMEENSSVLRAHENDSFEPEYDEDGNLIENGYNEEEMDQIAALTADQNDIDSFGDETSRDLTLNTEEIRAVCDEMLKNASDEASAILEAAKKEAEEIKNGAYGAGYEQGYSEGEAKAKEAIEVEKQKLLEEREALRQEYKDMLDEVEPKMVDTIASVYEHIFGNNFYNRRDVMVYLINKALMAANTAEKVIIYVSFDDYDRLYNMKAMLFDRTTFTEEPEIRPREDLVAGESKIETPFGIMDCSIDTELRELSRVLRLMSCGEN